MNTLIEQLINISDYSDRDDFYEDNIKKFTEEDRIYIVENLSYEENMPIIHTMLQKIKNIEVLEKFSLYGNYSKGAIAYILTNKYCTEKIIRGVYKQPKDSIIWKFELAYNLKKWGEDYYENVSSQINKQIEDGKRCPAAKNLAL
jgi:hypothetical protein